MHRTEGPPARFRIAPFRALRYQWDRPAGGGASLDLSALVAPPYDVISPEEHRHLLARSPFNIVRLTLGERPGERAPYPERAALLESWREKKILVEEPRAALYVYGVDYAVPGSAGRRRSLRGLLALGSLHDFKEGVVRPHERTFPQVVDDRYQLLRATRTHLELILLLSSERGREIDAALAEASRGPPHLQVEALPGETHALWSIRDPAVQGRLGALLSAERPIIADGHHRYTTACRYRDDHPGGPPAPGAGWQPMVLFNLFGDGLSILPTHRLVSLGGGGRAGEALRVLSENLAPAADGARADFEVETREARRRFSIPPALRSSRKGAAATSYAILHEVVLGEWLKALLGGQEAAVQYFKEGTGEREALREGKGDLLIRLEAVERDEFRRVVEGGEVFPHKTTFFYPKLWSGLALWQMVEPEPVPVA